MTTGSRWRAWSGFDALVSAMLHAAVDGAAAPVALGDLVQSVVATDAASRGAGVASIGPDGR